MGSLSALDWAWGLRTGEYECSSTVMLGNMKLRVQEKYRGVGDVEKKMRRGCETYRKKNKK